jgi:hypothetical protein
VRGLGGASIPGLPVLDDETAFGIDAGTRLLDAVVLFAVASFLADCLFRHERISLWTVV